MFLLLLLFSSLDTHLSFALLVSTYLSIFPYQGDGCTQSSERFMPRKTLRYISTTLRKENRDFVRTRQQRAPCTVISCSCQKQQHQHFNEQYPFSMFQIRVQISYFFFYIVCSVPKTCEKHWKQKGTRKLSGELRCWPLHSLDLCPSHQVRAS